jgi:hypothetical protein
MNADDGTHVYDGVEVGADADDGGNGMGGGGRPSDTDGCRHG